MKKKVISVLATMVLCFSGFAISVQASEVTNVTPTPRYNTCSTNATGPHGSRTTVTTFTNANNWTLHIVSCYFCGGFLSTY